MRRTFAEVWDKLARTDLNTCPCGVRIPTWLTHCNNECQEADAEARSESREPGSLTQVLHYPPTLSFENRGRRDGAIPDRTVNGEQLWLHWEVHRRNGWNTWHLRLSANARRVSPVGYDLPEGEEEHRAAEVWCRLEDRLLADLREAGVVR
ncbi:hypothetical protein I0C86_41565 [Plantactinospora sp. S1510]|uniref:Uncharacterized protein n=1 Tax=Plantactinospora alkalitolerans TaxID=2789879 RepID=A0ABS0HB57_9ACTN|nr:hypothetical protein [Plantactinospora alkalitolerans]MBF9135342.1 hypothetical protein [Plantactinospora alkalitolerans]